MLVVQLVRLTLLILGVCYIGVFRHLYNSVNDGGIRDKFYSRIMYENVGSSQYSLIVVRDVLDALHKQKLGIAVGCDYTTSQM